MKHRFQLLAIFFIALMNTRAFSQNLYTLPQLTPQSPNTASLGKYGDVPVSLSSGMANVSIPLLSLNVGAFSLPISLSYNNNGLKNDELASWVGMGWDIQAGGMITVEQRGNYDFDQSGLGMFTTTVVNPNSVDALKRFFKGQMTAQQKYDYEESVLRGDVDAEFDIFHYSFNGRSGIFYFDTNQNIISVPKNDLKITHTIDGFQIVDERGNIYIFTGAESSSMEPPAGNVAPRKSFNNTSAFLLTSIGTPDNRQITFNYQSYPMTYSRTMWSIGSSVGQTYQECPHNSSTASTMVYTSFNNLLYSISWDEGTVFFDVSSSMRQDFKNLDASNNVPYLKTLRLLDRNNVVRDSYTFNCSYFGTNNARLRLDNVVRSNTGAVSQKWSFDYNGGAIPLYFDAGKDHWGYFNGAQGVGTLDIPQAPYASIINQAWSAGNGNINKDANFSQSVSGVLQRITYPTGGTTDFTYEPNQITFLHASEFTSIPFLSTNSTQYGHTESIIDVNTDENTTVSGSFTLTKSTVLNVYAIRDYDPLNFTESQVYLNSSLNNQYTMPDIILQQGIAQGAYYTCTFGRCFFSAPITLGPGTFTYNLIRNTNTDFPEDRGYARLAIDTWVADDPQVTYPLGGCRIKKIVSNDGLGNTVTKRFEYTQTSDKVIFRNIPYYISVNHINKNVAAGGNNGGTIFCEPCKPEFIAHDESVAPMSGNPIEYRFVTEYTDDNNANGKTDYIYLPSDDYTGNSAAPYIPRWITTWRSGLPISTRRYKLSGSDYTLVSQDSVVYEAPALSNTSGVRMQYDVFCDQEGPDNRQFNTNQEMYVQEGLHQLSSIQAIFDNSGNITSAVSNAYSSTAHSLPTDVSQTNSRGEVIRQKSIYSLDYTTTTVSDNASLGVKNMKDKNILAPIEILTIKTVSGSDYVIAGMITIYKANAAVPDAVYRLKVSAPILLSGFTSSSINGSGVFVMDSRYEKRAEFNSYDSRNNVLQNRYADNYYNAYIWDYNSMHLAGEVKNAQQQDVAFTSFEADGTGNWTGIVPGNIDAAHAVTGARSYTLGSSLSRTGLATGTTYIVSYWSRTGSNFTVTGSTSVKEGRKINEWKYYEHMVTGVSTVAVSGTGGIDELRLYPKGAQMTTYTLSPLVGLTSQCDQSGKIIYYEYDGLSRLLRVRDMDGNVVKQYDYQYQVSTGCGSNCFILQMTTFAGTNTLSYPVGVFNVNGKLLGNATTQAQYVSLWNADTADANRGTLAAGGDSLHFNFTLTPGKTMPVLTGCRYYQIDLAYNKLDAVRNWNGCYVDWGDGTGMRLAANLSDQLTYLAPNTTQSQSAQPQFDAYAWYFVHTYPDNTQKTLTFYHNDAQENTHFDNVISPSPSLTYLKNLRGNLPQRTPIFGGHNYQQATMMQTAGIINWNSISSISTFDLGSGDGTNFPLNVSYEQDFMAGNRDLRSIAMGGPAANASPAIKLSRFKTDWSTYFTHMNALTFTDAQWDREDLSVVKELNYFLMYPAPGSSVPQTVIDNIFNQVYAGAGQTVSNGALGIYTGGTTRSSASNAAVTALKAKGWKLYLNGTLIP